MKAFQYVIGTLMRVDEKLLAQHIAHYKQTRQARDNAWVMKAVQSKVFLCQYAKNLAHSSDTVPNRRYAAPACERWLP